MGCINTVTSKPRQQEKIVSGARVRRGLHRGAGASAPADAAEAGLAILKHSYDLSDEALCERWVETPYDGAMPEVFFR